MDVEEILAFADTLRAYALESCEDLNAANLFTHVMLMHKLLAERQARDMREFWEHDFDADAA